MKHRSSLTVLSLAGAAMLTAGVGQPAEATQVVVHSHPENATIRGDHGASSPNGIMQVDDHRYLAGAQTTQYYVAPIAFELPELEPGQWIENAHATFTSYHQFGSEGNLDLYGTTFRSSPQITSEVQEEDWFGGGPNDPDATLIQAAIASPGISGSGTDEVGEVFGTDVDGQANLTDFLQGLYDQGAQGGDYAFLRLNTDRDLVEVAFYRIWSSNTNDPDAQGMSHPPTLTMTIVPEPTSLMLAGAGTALLIVRRRPKCVT